MTNYTFKTRKSMSPEIAKVPLNTTTDPQEWQSDTPPTDLVFDDGEPLESNRHRIAMNLLINSLKHHWSERTDFFVGGNMFVYYSEEQYRNRDFKGPDFFVVLNVDKDPTRQAWVVWLEGERYPDVIVELLSNSTETIDLTEKKELYENVFKTKDYFVFHPFSANSLQGWHADDTGKYQLLSPNPQGWLWCETLGLWLGIWNGMIEDDPADWLRFYDRAGNLVLLREEAEKQRADEERQRAEEERQRAKRLADRLRELGEDPDLI